MAALPGRSAKLPKTPPRAVLGTAAGQIARDGGQVVCHRGSVMRHARRLHREWSRKRDPRSPFETGQHELLVSLGISPGVAREIIAYLDGDLFNLWGRDPDDLMGIDGVGEVTVARLVAVLVLAAQFSERVMSRAA